MKFEAMVFDVDASMEYFVEAEGVRSTVFNITVANLPSVKQLDLEYHFPGSHGVGATYG